MEWAKDEIHRQLVGVGLIIYAFFNFLGLLMAIFVVPFLGNLDLDFDLNLPFGINGLTDIFGLIFPFIAGFIILLAAINIIAAILIFSKNKIGYYMGVVLCALKVFSFPFGTAFGIYGIIVMLARLKDFEPNPVDLR
jgi:hypothetical protein